MREAALLSAAEQSRAQGGLPYHHQRHERVMTISSETKVQAVRTTVRSALKWMEGREKAPTARDITKLPGGGKLGLFWHSCKTKRKCNRPPFDRLLMNPVLRADCRAVSAA